MYYIQQDIVSKYLFFLLYKQLQVILYTFCPLFSHCISDFSDPKRSLFCIEEDIQVLYKIKVIVHISIAKSILLLDR